MSQSQPAPPAADRTNRRQFIARTAALCGVLGSATSLPVLAAATLPPARSLRFVHTHTGETLSAPYFASGLYSNTCLNQVNYLLRDFRTGESHQIDPSLLDILYEVQKLANHDAPFEVISGYRSPRTNAMLHAHSSGVAEHSQHLLGKAIDVRLNGYSTRALGEHARSLSRGGVGFYAGSDFVHIDTGRVRFW